MKEKIYTICYYVDEQDINSRYCYLSAVNKVSYIVDAIIKVGHEVEIISLAPSKGGFLRGSQRTIAEGKTLTMFSSFGQRTRIRRIVDHVFIPIQLTRKFLGIRANSKVIVYHATSNMKLITFLARIKKVKLITEVEEIYGDVSNNERLKRAEMAFMKTADAYLFPTDMLNSAVNTSNKKAVIIHGTYQVEKQQICKTDYRIMHGWDASKIHVVYAGTFDPRKGGGIAAAAAAAYLSDSYHIHIIGFGNETDTRSMQELVGELAKKSACTVTYDGCLSGDDYIQFIQSCDIGLSTQNPDAAFNATSFPSKILSYMANGLRVVSIRIPAIEGSAIGKYMYYYEKQTSEEIAKAIMRVDLNDTYNGRDVISDLDQQFKVDIAALLGEV